MTRVSLIQPGARHNYAMARFLEQDGMLQRLYTDLAIGDGSPLNLLKHVPLPRPIGAALHRRFAEGIPHAKIDYALYRRKDDWLAPLQPWAVRHDDASATDIYYTQMYAGATGLRDSLPRPVKIVSDVFIVPSAHHVVNAEAAAFPEWREPVLPEDAVERTDAYNRRMLHDSDVLFCPARSVIDDVTRIEPGLAEKCVLVPYGSSMRFDKEAAPVSGRILFAGAVGLRKGAHYLGQAAKLIAKTDPGIRFVLAGSLRPEVRSLMAGDNVELLGHVGRDALAREFLTADLFAFPSLAEGSAGTALEALEAGLPIVTTRSAGIDFEDGEAGIYVGERDPEALAEAILKIVRDRALRAHLAAGAKRRARAYGMAEWRDLYCGNLRRIGGA